MSEGQMSWVLMRERAFRRAIEGGLEGCWLLDHGGSCRDGRGRERRFRIDRGLSTDALLIFISIEEQVSVLLLHP